MMRLYYSDVLSPRKACAVANYLKAPVEFVYLDLARGEQQQTPAYLAINPNGKVPTLIDGDRIIREADAVMCYLSDRMGSDLWPHHSRQIDIISWFSWNALHFNRAAGALYFEHIIKSRFGIGAPDRTRIEQALREFRRFAAVLNEHLKNRKWLVGDSLTVADFSAAVTLPHAKRASIPLDEFPEVRRWHEQLNEFQAWREPFPGIAN